MSRRWGWFPRQQTVAERRAANEKMLRDLRKAGRDLRPVAPGQSAPRSVWGRRWCEHFDLFADFRNRLARGRSYVRHGAVLHLELTEGSIVALVAGTDLYEVEIMVAPLPAARHRRIRDACAGRIDSLLELLAGRLDAAVMGQVTDPNDGLMPRGQDLELTCTCPDWAVMCKHVVAAITAVGLRLDEEPDLLFRLRGIEPQELVGGGALVVPVASADDGTALADEDLAGIFGIEVDLAPVAPPAEEPAAPNKAPRSRRKPAEAPSPRGARAFRPTGALIRGLRADFGLEVAELADVLDVSVATIYRWERADGPLVPRGRAGEALRRLAELREELLGNGD
ncbi:MAG: SWIM zinc finger family protein [Krumholzibacteria bacterium]|nr:SWIM zinc finger family protein [Candidatus Krumholzibacteria bacterium]